jgi:hypothetical protein
MVTFTAGIICPQIVQSWFSPSMVRNDMANPRFLNRTLPVEAEAVKSNGALVWVYQHWFINQTANPQAASAVLLTPRMIWKRRSGCMFQGNQPSVRSLVSMVKGEARLWARAGMCTKLASILL